MTIKTFSLNTNTGSKDTTTGKWRYVSFDIPNINVENGAIMSITNVAHDGNATNTIIRIKDISYNSSLYYSSDGSSPVLFAGNIANSNMPVFKQNIITLNKQALNYLTFYISDSITNLDSGVANGVNLIINIQIKED